MRDALLYGRVSLPGQAYLITTVTADRQPWFADLVLARCVIREMRDLHDSAWLHSWAWVVMPDHVHWLLQLGGDKTLSELIKAFKARSAQSMNRLLHRNGPVWQKGFHDHALRQDEDLQNLGRYIVANPLRAGLVARVGDYSHWDAMWL